MALAKCRRCNIEVPPPAKACPRCGLFLPRSTSATTAKVLVFVFGGLGLLVLGPCLVGSFLKEGSRSSAASPAQVSPRPAEPVIYVDIRTLLSEYIDNEVRADATFKGRYVQIDGIVDSVKRDVLDTIFITLGTGARFEIPQVQCYFSEAQATRAARVSKGARISVRGRVDGLFMNVLVKDCEFL